MVQISPGSTAIDLTRLPPVGSADPDRYRPSGDQTFARVVPDDDVEARAAALWAKRMGAKQVAALSDGSDFGRGTAIEFRQAASRLGLSAGRPSGAELVYYGGAAGRLAAALHGAGPVPVIGTDALLGPALPRPAAGVSRLYVTSPFLAPSLLPAASGGFLRAYRERFRRGPNPAAAYGYEAMSLVLQAIREAGSDASSFRDRVREAVIGAHRDQTVLGSYSITSEGDTTECMVQRYRLKPIRVPLGAPCPPD
jgi:branched-chain amino acid transport system substrate-binding protein